MAKRLSKQQISEIISCFKKGISLEDLCENFDATKLTITRNLKKNIGEELFKELAKKNKSESFDFAEVKKVFNKVTSDKGNKKSTQVDFSEKKSSNNMILDPQSHLEETFFEITPLHIELDNTPRKELSSVPLSEVDFPKVVYILVDKKIELEIKLLKDFPEWDFLPNEDLNRKTIEIFFDLNLAKRSCNKEQKVLKVPNTDVFRIAAPVLLEKGISRIVCAENLIAL